MFECKKRQWANNNNGTSFGETNYFIPGAVKALY